MRKPRVLRDGAIYHVTARANRKEMILDSGSMKELFLEVLCRARKRFDFRLDNFCIMGNHFHLMIQPGRHTNLSRLMQWIMSVFAMAFNRVHGLVGHVWGGRFFSRVISSCWEYLKTFKYIDENPVEAHQAENRRDWRYGGLWHHRAGLTDVCAKLAAFAEGAFPEHHVLLLPE